MSAKGKTVGYIRVSSFEQNTDRQLDGVHVDKLFTEKVSGKDMKRPQLQALLEYVRDGDTVIIHSLDRLARNLDDLRSIVQTLTGKTVKIQFIKESLIFTGDDNPMSILLLSVMGAFAEFERSLIKERQKEGICIAKQKGLYKGRKPSLNPTQIAEIRARAEAKENKASLAKEYGVSRETIYKSLR